MKKFIITAVLLSTIAIFGCNTSRGVGKDIEQTGENIQEGVERIGK